MSNPSDEEIDAKQMQELQGGRAYILNVIAYAFDSPDQPDQQHFMGIHGFTAAKRDELSKRFGCIFDKIFAAAVHYNREVVVLSKFGAGAFSASYPGDLFEEVWMPAFLNALSAWTGQLRSANVRELSLMGGDEEPEFLGAVERSGFSSSTYSYFPDPIRGQLGSKLASAMIVNAWDSWSIIGNGNFADHSLDGFIGRTTALAVLGWPVTNPHLEANMIEVTRPVHADL